MAGGQLEIPAVDGFRLSAAYSEPTGEARGAILVNPATGVRKQYYRPFAEYLAERGWHTVTFANRGIGGSRPPSLRRFDADMQSWAELDSEGVLQWMITRFTDLPLALVGHSFGGQSLGLIPSAGALSAAVLVATQSGWWGHWTGVQRLRMIAFWYVIIPALTTVLGYFPARRLGVGEDQPAGVARQWAHWGRHRDYILRGERSRWRAGYDALQLPILGLGFDDDPYAPRAAMAAILALYRNARMEHRHIDPEEVGLETVGHFGFFRNRSRHSLWADTADWLDDNVSRAGDRKSP